MNQVKDLDEEQRCAKSRKKSDEKFVPDGEWRQGRCQKRERKNGRWKICHKERLALDKDSQLGEHRRVVDFKIGVTTVKLTMDSLWTAPRRRRIISGKAKIKELDSINSAQEQESVRKDEESRRCLENKLEELPVQELLTRRKQWRTFAGARKTDDRKETDWRS